VAALSVPALIGCIITRGRRPRRWRRGTCIALGSAFATDTYVNSQGEDFLGNEALTAARPCFWGCGLDQGCPWNSRCTRRGIAGELCGSFCTKRCSDSTRRGRDSARAVDRSRNLVNDTPRLRRVYRTRSQAVALAMCAVLFPELTAVAIAQASGTLVIAIGVFVCLCELAITFRGATARLIVDDDELKIQDLFRTVVLPWAEVSSVTVGRYKSLGCVLTVRRRDGRIVPVFGVQGITGQPNRRSSVAARVAADELNDWLRRRKEDDTSSYRGRGGPPDPGVRSRAP
jgi:hypothetical protein